MEDHFLSQDIKDQIRLIMKEQMRLLLGEKSKNLEEATSYAETLIQKELEEDEASEADLPNALKTSSDPTESTFLTALKAGKEGLKPVPDPYAQILVAENLSVEALKPQITTNYIDTLKELKQKFAQSIDNSQLKDVKSLNEISDQVLKTPTGAFLKYAFNGEKDLEKALDHAVSTMLSKIKKDEKSKNRIASDTITDAIKTNYRGLKKEIIDLCRQVLINSVAHDDYYVLYHGHGNGLRLYVDMLREIKSYNDPYKLDRYIREI